MLHLIEYGKVSSRIEKELDIHQYNKVAILVDENTYEYCLPILGDFAHVDDVSMIGIKSGEVNKNITTADFIWKKMIEYGLDRKSLLINLGGGVICDIGGFCASTYMRGIDFIHIPTTLLAQVDASIGGKTGIDMDNYKNMVGTITQPKKVIIDTVFLKTLSEREVKSGFAEMIKHSLLDCMGHYRELMKININENLPDLSHVRKSVGIKEQIATSDPHEKNLRKTLNFGHTIGHAIETHLLSREKNIRHGEAIVVGMVCALYISVVKLDFDRKLMMKLCDEILSIYEPVNYAVEDIPKIIEIMKKDKKAIGGVNNFVLLTDVGRIKYDIPVENNIIEDALRFYISSK